MAKAQVSKKNVTQVKASKKIDISKMAQTHGALGATSKNPALMGWGSDYNTDEVDEYLGAINQMDTSELYSHSINLGEAPIEDRKRLIGRLEDRFRKYTAKRMPPEVAPNSMSAENKKAIENFMGVCR